MQRVQIGAGQYGRHGALGKGVIEHLERRSGHQRRDGGAVGVHIVQRAAGEIHAYARQLLAQRLHALDDFAGHVAVGFEDRLQRGHRDGLFGLRLHAAARLPGGVGALGRKADHEGAVKQTRVHAHALGGVLEREKQPQRRIDRDRAQAGLEASGGVPVELREQRAQRALDRRAVRIVDHQQRGHGVAAGLQHALQLGAAHDRHAAGGDFADQAAEGTRVLIGLHFHKAAVFGRGHAQRGGQRAGAFALAAAVCAGEDHNAPQRQAGQQIDGLVVGERIARLVEADANIAYQLSSGGIFGFGQRGGRVGGVGEGDHQIARASLGQQPRQLIVEIAAEHVLECLLGRLGGLLRAGGLGGIALTGLAQGGVFPVQLRHFGGVAALELIDQLGALVGAHFFQLVDFAEHLQAVGLQAVERLLALAVVARLTRRGADAQRVVQIVQLEQRRDQTGARLGQRPGLPDGLHGLVDRADDRIGGRGARHGMTQLIEPRLPPHIVDDVLNAGAAVRIKAALLLERLRARRQAGGGHHAREDIRRMLEPGLGRAFGRLFALGGAGGDPLDGPVGALFSFNDPFGRLFGASFGLGGGGAGRGGFRRFGAGRLGGLVGNGTFLDALLALGGGHAPCAQIQQQLNRRVVYGDVYQLRRRVAQILIRQRIADDAGRVAAVGPGVNAAHLAVLHDGDQRRAGRGEQPVLIGRDGLGHEAGVDARHHVGIDDEGVAVAGFPGVVLVGADLVVFAGVAAQIEQTVASEAPHARFEVRHFVFVGHNPDESILKKFLAGVLHDLITVFFLDDQRTDAKKEFLWIIFLEKANGQLSGQYHFQPLLFDIFTDNKPYFSNYKQRTDFSQEPDHIFLKNMTDCLTKIRCLAQKYAVNPSS